MIATESREGTQELQEHASRVCAWCGDVMAKGESTEPISHGICPICEAEQHRLIDEEDTC